MRQEENTFTEKSFVFTKDFIDFFKDVGKPRLDKAPVNIQRNRSNLDDLQCLKPMEVAERLKISKTKVYGLMKSGQLPYFSIGGDANGDRRIRISDLRAYLAKRLNEKAA